MGKALKLLFYDRAIEWGTAEVEQFCNHEPCFAMIFPGDRVLVERDQQHTFKFCSLECQRAQATAYAERRYWLPKAEEIEIGD